MDVVVVDKVVEEVNKVVEEVNKELVMDVVVEGVVDKEVTKVVWWRRSTRSWSRSTITCFKLSSVQ